MISAGLRACLKSSPEFAFTDEECALKDARASISARKPDLLLMDLSPPTSLCFTTLTDLRKSFPQLPVLILSTEDESLYAERALHAGAHGYVMEQTGCAVILKAIAHVLSGRLYLSPDLSEAILERVKGKQLPGGTGALDVLGPREFDVFQLIGHGKATREIAAHLHLSPKTVAVHRNHIRNKLKLRTGTELVQFAIRFCEREQPAQSLR